MGYDNIKIIGNTATIQDDIPWINIDIEVDFLVLRFQKEAVIRGVITKSSNTSIDLLVFNTFNAQVVIPNIMSNTERHKFLQKGVQISFQMTTFEQTGNG